MRRQYFLFDPEYTPLNHGSYGAFPTVSRDHQRNLQDRIEARDQIPFYASPFQNSYSNLALLLHRF
jgi:hercynylcysteine S-oxide lyase